ncbi:MAG TPA: zinc-dependent metalloprotease [Rubrivivax sp.]|nr:zinc-dependent metalloprotease [Burkholderiales bacterium]HNT37872.1 zinc-dependent metalloprotease [Rubrivivax sp.]
MYRTLHLVVLALAAALAGAGCANLPGTAAASGAAPAAPAASAPTVAPGARPPTPGAVPTPQPQPQPFGVVVKDARRIDGLITVWQKDDKFWFELRPEDFDKPFFFSPKIAQGMGERGFFGGTMIGRWGSFGRQQTVVFHRVHKQVQLRALNTAFEAEAATPAARAVRAGFSASLLGSAAIASQPHPDRKSVLVEANGMLLGDLLGLALHLQRSYRQNYAMDRGNSAITRVRGKAAETVFELQAHFATATLAQAGPTPVPVPPALQPSEPRTLPDARSLFLGLHYAFAELPATPMAPRRADPRVGHFTTNVADFSDDLARTPQRRYVNRWRLEKKDPAAELSEPVKPITFWLDRSIPLKYRDAILRGVLGWNSAFEKIGFKDAIVARIQPDDADFDTLDVGAASLRWMTNASPTFGAIGPSQVDPRSGEILDADIGIESLSSRNLRALRSQVLSSRAAPQAWSRLMQLGVETDHAADAADAGIAAPDACDYADFAAEQLAYALDVLEARGEIDPASPEAEAFVQDYLTDVTMHEVGHTLGLRHNFRSSRAYTLAQMNDPAFVAAHGLAGSVMEYAPINLSAPGAPAVPAFQKNLGPYDDWAIEYAYKPMPPGSTAVQEEDELQRIAARSAEPQLAYGTDEDNGLGLDPESLIFDLGDDPVAFADQRVAIAQELLQRQATRELDPDADYAVLRRSVGYAIREMGRAAGVLARQIGGLRTLRDFPGSGRDPLQPVAPALQRAALQSLSRHFLSADALQLPPALQRRLAPDYLERSDARFAGDMALATDFSPASQLLELQRVLLKHLLGDAVAERVLDGAGKLEPGQALALSELYAQLARDVFGELDAKAGDIAAPRRELQREYAVRLAAVLLRPSAQGRADQRSLLRQQARELLAGIGRAQRRAGLSAESRAHLADLAEMLRQGLNARINRPA